jgi:hypothetical protein
VKYNESLINKDEKQVSPKDRSTIIPVETSIKYLKSEGKQRHIKNVSSFFSLNDSLVYGLYFFVIFIKTLFK